MIQSLARRRAMPWATTAVSVLSLAFANSALATFSVFSAGGDTSAGSIQGTVDAFRAALGNPNNGNTPGPLASGRREINWDGGGAAIATASGTPLTAFTNIRGATFNTAGTGFLQTPLNAPELAALNPLYATTFGLFSPLRVFTPVGSNTTDVTFSIPGTNGTVPATVAGFGAIFTDVDLANTTSLQFFGPSNNSLLSLYVAPGTVSSASLSFLGAVATAGEQIARVRITTGNSTLGPVDGAVRHRRGRHG